MEDDERTDFLESLGIVAWDAAHFAALDEAGGEDGRFHFGRADFATGDVDGGT